MKELLAAITTHFNVGSDLKTALSSQLYPHEAEQTATFPYGIYYIITENTDYNFTDEEENITVQFTYFSDDHGPAEILTLEGYSKALFDNAVMSVTGYRLLQFKRSDTRLLKDAEMDTWSLIVEYDVMIEKDRS